MSLSFYGLGMHDFVLDELELGTRVVSVLDDEMCGYGPLLDLMLAEDIRAGRLT